MNHYVSLSLTIRKCSVHLHALYSPRTTLGTFTTRRDQLVICGQYGWHKPSPRKNVIAFAQLIERHAFFHKRFQTRTAFKDDKKSIYAKASVCSLVGW
jgi:hypothetical protein